MQSIYDNYRFENRKDNAVAGYSCLTKPKYSTLVIPMGLVVNNHTDDIYKESEPDVDYNMRMGMGMETDRHMDFRSNDTSETSFPVINDAKFDVLFYSVGKSLGKSRSTKTRKNKSKHDDER